jgi:hypothetical protein
MIGLKLTWQLQKIYIYSMSIKTKLPLNLNYRKSKPKSMEVILLFIKNSKEKTSLTVSFKES